MDEFNILDNEIIQLLEQYESLSPLIRKILIRNVLKNIVMEDDEVSNIKALFFRQQNIKDDKHFEDWLATRSLTEESFIQKIIEPFKLTKYLTDKYFGRVHAHFLTRKTKLDQVIYSLLRVSDKYTAQELYLRILGNEESFSSLALKFSEGDEKEVQGIVGPIPIEQSHPALAKVLKNSTPGKLNKPFQIGGFWLIVRVESFKEAILNSDMEMQMAKELFDEWLKEEISKVVKELKLKNSATTTLKEAKN